MGIGYTAELSTPQIYPIDKMHNVLDQGKAAVFAAAIKQGSGYVRPSGNAAFYWEVWRAGEIIQAARSISLPVTTSEGTPPWAQVTVPADTFPADGEGHGPDGGLSVRYWITFSGWGGMCTVPLDSSGNLQPRAFGTIKPPEVVDAAPGEGAFLNDTIANTLAWGITYNKDYTVSAPVGQASAAVQWRDGEAGSIHTVNVTGKTPGVSIPANTFPAATAALQWRVLRVTMADGAQSGPTGWSPLTTVDSLSAAQIVSPNGAYLTGNEENVFSWRHVIATGTAQGKAELQVSANAGAFWLALRTVTGAAQSVTLPAGALPGGSLLWRVRTYNSDNAAGAWSEEAAIVVYAAPPPPALLPAEPVPRPVLRWQSAGQQAYEARVDGVSFGAVFGTAKEWRVPAWLPDGAHALGVRVQSSLGLWSGWGGVTVTVANAPPGEVSLTARGIENGARLSWAARGDFDRFLVYRDGEAVGETAATQWVDWLANGRHRYTVRGVAGEHYALSNEVWEWSRCRWGVLSALDEISWIPLRVRRGSQPEVRSEASRAVTLRYFDGRGLPVAEVSPFVDRVVTFDYTMRGEEREALPALRALLGRTVLYKNRTGARVAGLLSSLSEQDDGRAVELSFSITETDTAPSTTDAPRAEGDWLAEGVQRKNEVIG